MSNLNHESVVEQIAENLEEELELKDWQIGYLNVRVIHGRNLWSDDASLSNPYCKFTYPDVNKNNRKDIFNFKIKTKSIGRTLNPIFN